MNKGKLQAPQSLPLRIKALLAPVTADEFYSSYCSKTYCYVPGTPEKFTGLFSWAELNEILESRTLGPPQLELYKSGASVDPLLYVEYRVRDRSLLPRVLVKEFTDQLRDGATLTLSHIHELHPRLGELSDSLERSFSAVVGINLYAAWRSLQGFGVHRDPHDVFVAQVAGRKRWSIYGPAPGEDGKPPSQPAWEGTIRAGDLLYIPRGYWHAAVPLDEPSLHLTISIENPAVPDILCWLAGELREKDVGQASVSSHATETERALFVERMKDVLMRALEPEVIGRYFESSDEKRRARARFSLPWSATPESLPLDGTTLLRLRSRRAPSIHLDSTNRELTFKAGGKTWRFPSMMAGVFEALKGGGAVSVEKLVAAGRGTLGAPMARAFVATLVKEGIIAEEQVEDE